MILAFFPMKSRETYEKPTSDGHDAEKYPTCRETVPKTSLKVKVILDKLMTHHWHSTVAVINGLRLIDYDNRYNKQIRYFR